MTSGAGHSTRRILTRIDMERRVCRTYGARERSADQDAAGFVMINLSSL